MSIDLEKQGQDLTLRLKASFALGKVEYYRKRWFRSSERCVILWGIRGGELTAWLRNGNAPWEGRYKKSIQETETVSSGGSWEESSERTGSGTLGLSAEGPAAQLGGERKSGRKKGGETGEEYVRATVATTGPDDAPRWQFQPSDRARHLFGAAPGYDPPLAAIKTEGDPVEVLAAFHVQPRDLCSVDVQAPFGSKTSRKKLAVIGKCLPRLLAECAGAEGKNELVIAFARNRHLKTPDRTGDVIPGEGSR